MLSSELHIKVRFSEVDALGMVWHGNYVKYLEDGREAFGEEHGLSYLFIKHNAFYTPIVDLQMQYKKTVKYGSTLRLKITWIPQDAAKLVFHYELFNELDELCLSAQSVQVFINAASDEMEWYFPQFYLNWKEGHGLS